MPKFTATGLTALRTWQQPYRTDPSNGMPRRVYKGGRRSPYALARLKKAQKSRKTTLTITRA